MIAIAKSIWSRYRLTAARHPAIAAVLALLAATIMATALARGRGRQAAAYFAALALSVFAIDAVFLWRPIAAKETPVRYPRAELLVAFLSFLVAFAWLVSRFVSAYTIPSPILRLAALSAVFNIPFVLALAILRYRPKDLGIRFRGFAPAVPVILCFGLLAAALTPSSITLKAAYGEAGSVWGLLAGSLGAAALPEEFFRFVWQTRAGVCLNNRAAGWLIASVLWAALHAPVEYSDSHAVAETLTYILGIIPVGLLWGYLTMRTQSILPSVLLHGVNFWGLQNL